MMLTNHYFEDISMDRWEHLIKAKQFQLSLKLNKPHLALVIYTWP